MAATSEQPRCDSDAVRIVWSCGNSTTLPHLWLRDNCGCRDCRIAQTDEKKFMVSSVPADLEPASAELSDDQLRFVADGAMILEGAPTEPGTLEYLAPRLGPGREVLFDRIHDVAVDPCGYNVAHTPLPLPPHVSERNHWIVRHHGLFQGYYWFEYDGQDPNARDLFKDHKFYDDCVEFCARWDQVSFDPNYETRPLQHFEPLVRDLFARQPNSRNRYA